MGEREELGTPREDGERLERGQARQRRRIDFAIAVEIEADSQSVDQDDTHKATVAELVFPCVDIGGQGKARAAGTKRKTGSLATHSASSSIPQASLRTSCIVLGVAYVLSTASPETLVSPYSTIVHTVHPSFIW
jgi:hypothetical protein